MLCPVIAYPGGIWKVYFQSTPAFEIRPMFGKVRSPGFSRLRKQPTPTPTPQNSAPIVAVACIACCFFFDYTSFILSTFLGIVTVEACLDWPRSSFFRSSPAQFKPRNRSL
jgi:hypothetical protein